jgi:hypothetical protein
MKYLNKFESNDIHIESLKMNQSEFGITPDEIKYLFTDISDNGWTVNAQSLKKLKELVYDESKNSILNFYLIPYIQVSINKTTPFEQRFNRSEWKETQELKSFTESDEFKEIIEVISLRLNDLGYYINKQVIENKQLNILIYRKTD